MGCDIHMVLERKVNDKWIGVDTFKAHGGFGCEFSFPAAIDRNYARFARLAGVRGPGPMPRGVPQDASDTSKLMIEDLGIDGHSHSWLPIEEAAQIFLETEYFGHDGPSDYIQRYPASQYFGVSENLKDYRLVFWFDN